MRNEVEPNSTNVTSLMDYNSPSNYYTCPSDGYVYINSWGTNSATIYTVGGFGINFSPNQQTTFFCKKGCRLYCTVTGTSAINVLFFKCLSV